MKDSFERSLLEAGSSMKKGYKLLAENAGKATALITLLICALVLFTDIGFSDFKAESFTGTLAVMLFSSYLIYFSMNETGEQLGERSEEYTEARDAFLKLRERISGEDMPRLRDFCKKYSEDELFFRRESYLLTEGYTGADFDKFMRSEAELDKRGRAVMRRARRMRAVPLIPRELLEGETHGKRSELSNPDSFRAFRLLAGLLPTSVGMIVTVSVMLTLKENLDAATVADGVFKLASLLIIGFRGYSGGYAYAKNTKTLWLRTRARLLEAFLKS